MGFKVQGPFSLGESCTILNLVFDTVFWVTSDNRHYWQKINRIIFFSPSPDLPTHADATHMHTHAHTLTLFLNFLVVWLQRMLLVCFITSALCIGAFSEAELSDNFVMWPALTSIFSNSNHHPAHHPSQHPSPLLRPQQGMAAFPWYGFHLCGLVGYRVLLPPKGHPV